MIKGNRQARAELEGLIHLGRRIDAATEEVKRLSSHIGSIQSSVASVRVSGTKRHDIGDGVAALLDLRAELDADIDMWIAERRRIVRRIYAIEPKEYSALLYYYYVLVMPLYQVAARMGYSYIWARIRHGEALAAYQERYFGK